MWPWEHAAAGYVVFSLAVHAAYSRSPTEGQALLLVAATQVPDLVDKPLAWGLGLFPSGYAIAHSAFVAIPVALLVAALVARRGRSLDGAAVIVGYWSHLVADVVDPLRSGGSVVVDRVLWPVANHEPYARDLGVERGLHYFVEFVTGFPPTGASGLALVFVGFPLLAFGLWLVDGAPGFGLVRRVADAGRR